MRVLLGVDDSPFSDDAIRYVIEAVWPPATSFSILSVATPILVGPGEAAAPKAIKDLMEQQQRYHREIAERAASRLRRAGLAGEARMAIGDPRTWIVETARNEHADLIVVGSHGRSGLKKIFLGSVASHVVTHAPCPVLVVKSARRITKDTDRQETDSTARPFELPVV